VHCNPVLFPRQLRPALLRRVVVLMFGREKAVDLNGGQRSVVYEAVAVSEAAVTRHLGVVSHIEVDGVRNTDRLIAAVALSIVLAGGARTMHGVVAVRPTIIAIDVQQQR